MLGINFDLEKLKKEWKTFLIAVVVLALLWFMVFFVYNRSIITDYSFHIPIILCITLAIFHYLFSLLYMIGFTLIFKSSLFDKSKNKKELKEERNRFNFMLYAALFFAIILIFIIIYQTEIVESNSISLRKFIIADFKVLAIICLFSIIPAFISLIIKLFSRTLKS